MIGEDRQNVRGILDPRLEIERGRLLRAAGWQVAVKDRRSSGLREKWRGRGTEGCCRYRNGCCWLTCCRGWTKRRCSFGSGCRCMGRCRGRTSTWVGDRTGGCCDARAGCRSGRSCSTGNRCCCGSMSGCQRECRSWGRSKSPCSSRSGCCCRRENRGRIRGKDSPYRLGDGVEEAIQSAKCKRQNGGTDCRERTWDRADAERRGKIPECHDHGKRMTEDGLRCTVYESRVAGRARSQQAASR
jgi:hypothetical protein